MEIYPVLYPLSGVLSIFVGFYIFRKYHNSSAFFFFLFTIGFSLWYGLYFLFFSGISNYDILLLLSRSAFATGMISIYSLLFSLIYFHRQEKHFYKRGFWFIIGGFMLIAYIFIGSNMIIDSLEFDPINKVYREVYGAYYPGAIVGYSMFLICYIGFSIKQIITLKFISRLRFQHIAGAGFLFLFLLIFLQVVLPLFNIWILEKEIIFLYLFFVIHVFFSIKKYHFSPLHQEYGFIKIGISILSFILSLLILNGILYIFPEILSLEGGFWNVGDKFHLIDSTIIVVTYLIFYKLLKKWLPVNDSENEIKQHIDTLKQSISDTTNIESLNKELEGGMRSIFTANHSKVVLFENNGGASELGRYFSESVGEKIFINDIVFIEEHRTKFDKSAILKEVDKDTMLVFPIMNTEGRVSGLCFIGKKPFGDFYTVSEIKNLFSLMKFLGLHMKYIITYTKIQDLSLHLDARIDEKTLEYNDLINQQKEFISMISHEIRSPIGSTIFQIDSLVDDIDNHKMVVTQIRHSIQNIGAQLADIGELLKKLFSIQYFDTRTVTLLKEKIHIGTLLEKEFDVYSRMYEDITFIRKISPDIGFVNIDKIHFQQVITNLIENAMKFANPTDPTILIEAARTPHDTFRINIEDNGPGYGDTDPTTIFEKYSTSNHAKIGLGLGLYLCKRIVTMHDGTIIAGIGKTLPGASFTIEMPK